MHRLTRRAAARMLLTALAAGLLAWFLAGRGIAWASEFCGIAAFFVTILAYVIGWLRGPLPMSTVKIDQEADDLADALQRQLTREENIRQVDDPGPMPVRWEVTASSREAMHGVRLDPGTSDESVPALAMVAGSFDERVLSAFLRVRSRRLVILGSSGAGKSVLAMKLEQGLLGDLRGRDRVPVFFSAATWDPASDLFDWMAVQLVRGYPVPARKVKAVTGEVTSLASALAVNRILPIVDGLDELPEDARVKAIAMINDAGSKLPLIVTSRTREYLAAIAGRAISRAQVIELVPLRIAEVKEYLKEATAAAPAGRWEAVFSRLDDAPDGPLAAVLTTPLMLWLARTSYQAGSRDPGELADDYRLPDKRSVEHHLLDGFVPAVYDRKNALSRFACSAQHARRWLAFLATKTHSQDLQWWQLARTVRALQPISVAIRAALLFAIAWRLAVWVLQRRLDEHGADPRLLLGGPLGHRILPTVTYIKGLYLTPAYHTARHAVDDAIDFIPWHSFWTLELWVVVGAACIGALQMYSGTRPVNLQVVKVQPLTIARGIIPALGPAVCFLIMFWCAFVLGMPEASQIPAVLYRTPSARLLLLLVLLWGLTNIPLSLKAPLDVSRSVSPRQALQLDRQATLLPIVVRRTLRAALVWLLFGLAFALAYVLYALANLLCRIALGSTDTASGGFSEARAWFACTRRLPWRIMGFLEDAHLRGVLRQVGTGYQFRHIRLQERLSASYWEPSMPVPMLVPLLDLRRTLWAVTAKDAWRPYESSGIGPESAPGHSSTWPAQERWPLKTPQPLPGEDYLFSCRKHPAVLTGRLAISLCALLAAATLSATASGYARNATLQWVLFVWVIFAVFFLRLVERVAGWVDELFVVTSQRIFVRSGVPTSKVTIRKSRGWQAVFQGIRGRDHRTSEYVPSKVMEVRLSRVTHLRVEQSFLGRMLGYGSLFFESATVDQTLRVASHVPQPENVFAELSCLLGLSEDDPDT